MTAPIIVSYHNWLKSKSYSSSTIRNYIVDLKKYLIFSNPNNPETITDNIFNQNNLAEYFQNINQDQNYKRFLASLSKFFQYALDQSLISENPFPKALKIQPEIDINNIIKTYKLQLQNKKFSPSTIRNYINDIQQFINWNQKTNGS